MLEAVVGVLSTTMIALGVGGALIASGAWLSARKYEAQGEKPTGKRSEGSTRRGDE